MNFNLQMGNGSGLTLPRTGLLFYARAPGMTDIIGISSGAVKGSSANFSGATVGILSSVVTISGDFEFSGEFIYKSAVTSTFLGGNSTTEGVLGYLDTAHDYFSTYIGGTECRFTNIALTNGVAYAFLLKRVGTQLTLTINGVSQTLTRTASNITLRYVGAWNTGGSSSICKTNIHSLKFVTISGEIRTTVLSLAMMCYGSNIEWPLVAGTPRCVWSNNVTTMIVEHTTGFGYDANQDGYSKRRNVRYPINFSENTVWKVVCIGDSTTQQGYPSILAGLLPKSTVVNKGMSGDKSNETLARFAADVVALDPDYALIMIGVNDRRWHYTAQATIDNISAMVTQCLINNIIPVVAHHTPWGDAVWTQADQDIFAEINSWIDSTAASLGFPVVDVYNGLLNPGTHVMQAVYDSGDHLHPNTAGYTVIANLFLAAITTQPVQTNLTGRLKYNLTVVSGTGPSDWVVKLPEVPELIKLLGLNSAYYDVNGAAIAITYSSHVDTTKVRFGNRSAVCYATDQDVAAIAGIDRVIGNT